MKKEILIGAACFVAGAAANTEVVKSTLKKGYEIVASKFKKEDEATDAPAEDPKPDDKPAEQKKANDNTTDKKPAEKKKPGGKAEEKKPTEKVDDKKADDEKKK